MGQIKVWHLLLGVIMVIVGVTMMEFAPLLLPPEQIEAPPSFAGTCVDNSMLDGTHDSIKGVFLACRGEGQVDNMCWVDSKRSDVVACLQPDGSVKRLHQNGSICIEKLDGSIRCAGDYVSPH